MKKDDWKDYLSFSKKERNAVIILLLLIVVFIVLPYFISSKQLTVTVDKETEKRIAALSAPGEKNDSVNAPGNDETTAVSQPLKKEAAQQAVLFFFNPNTIDEAGWKKLGLKDKTIKTLINYRNKGGRFYKAADIGKIYGLSKGDADRLIPFIQISSAENPQIKTYSKQSKDSTKSSIAVGPPPSKIKTVHINTATAEEWKALPGIGDVLSNRIVKFRNKIGSFTSIEQVSKTYGLQDSVFQKIKPFLVLE